MVGIMGDTNVEPRDVSQAGPATGVQAGAPPRRGYSTLGATATSVICHRDFGTQRTRAGATLRRACSSVPLLPSMTGVTLCCPTISTRQPWLEGCLTLS